jgi:hypothetical protein
MTHGADELVARLRMYHTEDETRYLDRSPNICDEAADMIEDLARICAEAYQVVGVLADDCGRFGGGDIEHVLDNLSQQRLVHEDVLPFKCAAELAEKGK